jgi:hypothetical protein
VAAIRIINLAHPLTEAQLRQVESLVGEKVEEVIDVPSQVDPGRSLAPQAEAMLEAAGLTTREWQTLPLIVNLPSLNFSAAVVLAHLHGRMGCFPAVLRLRPVPNAGPTRYEVAEILNLQSVRESARRLR